MRRGRVRREGEVKVRGWEGVRTESEKRRCRRVHDCAIMGERSELLDGSSRTQKA